MNINQSNESTSSSADQYSTRTIILFTSLALVALLTIVINSFVIVMVYCKQFLRTVTNFCLASLACSDLLSGLCAVPLIIICSLTGIFKVCVAMDCSQRFLATSTIIHLLMITLERYYTIVYSTTYSGSAVSKRLCRVSLFGIWLFSFGVALVQLSWIKRFPSSDEEDAISKIEVTYGAVTLTVIVLVPLTIMIFCYTHILLTLRRHVAKITQEVGHVNIESERRHRRKERNALLIFVAMIVVFVIGWFNYFFNGLQNDLGFRQRFPFWADALLILLRFSTSLLNPILYTFLKQDFRKACRSLIESMNNCAAVYSSTNRKIFDISDIRAKRGVFSLRKSKRKYEVQEPCTQLTGTSVKDSQNSNVLPTILINNHICNLMELHELPAHVKTSPQHQAKSFSQNQDKSFPQNQDKSSPQKQGKSFSQKQGKSFSQKQGKAGDKIVPMSENFSVDGKLSLDKEKLQDSKTPREKTVQHTTMKVANHNIVPEITCLRISDQEEQNGECYKITQAPVPLDCQM